MFAKFAVSGEIEVILRLNDLALPEPDALYTAIEAFIAITARPPTPLARS